MAILVVLNNFTLGFTFPHYGGIKSPLCPTACPSTSFGVVLVKMPSPKKPLPHPRLMRPSMIPTTPIEPSRNIIFRRWVLNVIEQNRQFASFPRILARLDEVIANFLLKQWHERVNQSQLETIRHFILDYLNLTDLPDLEPNPPKHPPTLKIRGLVHRDRGDQSAPKKKVKQKRSKSENLEILARKQQKLDAN